MEFTGVYHKTSEQMSYPYNENQLIVNIKTGYDVKRVFIHYGDPFDAGILGGKEKWTGKREEICYKKRLKHQLWWTTTLVPHIKDVNIILSFRQTRKPGIILRTDFYRGAASYGWKNASVFYCSLDESGRSEQNAGMGERYYMVSDFSWTGSAMEHRRKIQRIFFHGEPDRLPTENGMEGIFPESVRSWII